MVLNIRVMAYNNPINIATQYRTIPHTGMIADCHVTDDNCAGCNINLSP